MENLNIRKRVFENLGDLHYTADVYKIFGDEQKKYRRQFKKFWQRLQKDKQLINELLFRRQLHTKLSGPTYKTLVYAFAKAYHERTDVQVLKEYTSALMGRYDTVTTALPKHPTERTGPDKLYYRRHQGHGHLQRQKDTGFHAPGNDSADSDVGHEVRQGNRTCHRPSA